MNNTLESILGWFKTAKPNPSLRDICAQLGAHFEEISEMFEACNHEPNESRELSSFYYEHPPAADNLAWVDRKALLDSLCDQIVTAIGVGYMFNLDILGALAEVDASNWSKFENGAPLFNENGKIIKGRNYQAPQLDKFVRSSGAYNPVALMAEGVPHDR